ncbi:hypothetical protein ACFLVM_03650 [Chloroflexota bacterium]
MTDISCETEKVYINYNYESRIGSIHKIIWYYEGKVLHSSTHEATSASGSRAWSRADSWWEDGDYKAELFINDSLLTTVTWIAY